ncbi:MAG TPA: chaperonin GroEL, partial [Candidatus Angelobacter sp.]|nr:chaperonin GroEL [Candidatus Angelobacter sp.]
QPCDGEKILQIAATASGDEHLAKLVVEAMKKVGKDGVITVQQSKSAESTLEVEEGLRFDRGYISSGFVTDEIRQECILHDCYVLVYERSIQSMRDFLPLLEQVAKSGKPILIISENVEGEALATLVLNKERGTVSCVAIKPPGFGDRRQSVLEDIAIMTGARPFIQERIVPLANIRLGDLGHADLVTVTRDETTILGGGGKPELIEARIKELRHRIEQASSDYDREKLYERLAKIAAGIAVIHIGGITDSDRAESFYRVESAMHSTRAAVENGVVVGGGLEYIRAKPFVEKLVAKNEQEKAGIQAVLRALEQPLRQLIINSKVKSPEHVFISIEKESNPNVGFNADSGAIEDLSKTGIIDPAKTLKEALLFAFSYAKGIVETGAWDLQASENLTEPDQS